MTLTSMEQKEWINILQPFRKFSSTDRKEIVGLYRLAAGGIIDCGYYNYTTQKIGPYKINEHMGFQDWCFSELAPFPMRVMYENMLTNKTALATFIVNNEYLCTVYDNYRDYINLRKPSDVRQVNEKVQRYDVMLNVGYVVFKPKCLTLYQVPQYLQYGANTKTLFLGDGEYVELPEAPKTQVDLGYGLYKKLLQSGKRAIYFTRDGEEKFI